MGLWTHPSPQITNEFLFNTVPIDHPSFVQNIVLDIDGNHVETQQIIG